VTAEVTEQNEQMRQDFSIQLETKIQEITREVELIKRGTNKELSMCMQKCKSECDKVNKRVNDHKAQTKTNVDSLKVVVNQNKEEIENKLEELTREVRTITAIVDECNDCVQRDKRSTV